MPRTRLVLVLAALLLMTAAPAATAATGAYPDLRTLPPRDLQFAVTDTSLGANRNVLRFTNTVWNAGEGDLRIGATVPPGTSSAPATQTVALDDGTTLQRQVGAYTIHPEHQHFHYDGWGRYELWTKAVYDQWIAEGRPYTRGPDLVGAKTTSCILDEEFIDTLPGTPYPRRYPDSGCDPTNGDKIASGLAVGWGDTYDRGRYDQWIDLGANKLSDGEYVLRSVTDPGNKVYESPDKADPSRESVIANEAITIVKIAGGVIQDLERPSGTVTINDVRTSTTSPNVTVRVLGRDDVSGVGEVRVSNDGVTWDTRPYGGSGSSPMSISWDLTDTRFGGSTTGGERTVYVQFKDRSGKWSATETDTINYTAGTTPTPDPGSNSLYATAVLSDAPISYWRLAETTSTTAADERGRHPGSYSTGAQRGVPGLLSSDTNRAVRLDGSSRIAVPEASTLAISPAVSLEAWIKPEAIPAPGGWASVVSRPEGYSLQFNGPQLEFTIIQSGARKRLKAPVGAIAVGGRYHVVGTYDGQQQRLYINGELAVSAPLTGPVGAGRSGLGIGAWEGNEFFTGTIDEVAVYASMLTGLQVKQHHDAGISTAVGVPTPTGLAATPASASRIDLRWTDNATSETGFVVERSTSSSFTSPTAITVPADSTTYADTGLPAGTTFHYRVKAVTATDSSAWSAPVTASTAAAPPPEPTAPAAPTALQATAASTGTVVDLRWADNASDETGYELERSTSATFTDPTRITLGAGATTRADTAPAAGTTYHYRVRAVKDALASAWSNTASATTAAAPPPPPPPPPAGYAATVAEDRPVSHWRLGERSGTVAADATGANTGSMRNGIGLAAASLLARDPGDTAVRADGVNDHVHVADAASLDLTTAITVEAWIRPDAIPVAGRWASVVTKAESYSLQFNGPRLEFTVMQSGSRRRLQAPAGAIAAGGTYHVVGTYDGATQRLYLNGAMVASRAQTGPASVGTWPVTIGSWSGFGEFFRGTIDDVAVYATTLPAARVSAHHAAGAATATARAASARAARTTATASAAVSGRLGPAQRLTAGLSGPGPAARRRACRAARVRAPHAASRARQAQRAAAVRACRVLRRR